MKHNRILTICILLIAATTQTTISKPANIHFSTQNILNRQTDTAKYLKDNISIFNNNFSHKRLVNFIGVLKLHVVFYMPLRNHKPGQPLRGIILYFENKSALMEKKVGNKSLPSLLVQFENNINFGKALIVYAETKGMWSAKEDELYGQVIIKNIKIAGD